MKFLTEVVEDVKVEVLTESINGESKKNYYIEGIFLQGDVKNRNGRLYPTDVLESACSAYMKNFITERRAMGELGHPDSAQINLDRVSHIITDLRREGNNFIGRAKILDTPMGKIAKNLIDEGIKLGVSSRGFATIKQKGGVKMVGGDFHLATVDIVSDPSAPQAFVENIMESKDFYIDNGIIKEKEILNSSEKTTMKKLDESKLLDLFTELLK